jgi:histidinol phosphatase-like PHP family hydrolase
VSPTPSVLNVIAGQNDFGGYLTQHPDIAKVAFTGSTATGKTVMASVASAIKRVCVADTMRITPDVRNRLLGLASAQMSAFHYAKPLRLDLDDLHARAAREREILLSIASDRHSANQLDYRENGVRQAQRAWVTRKDVLNARPLTELRSLLRRTMR